MKTPQLFSTDNLVQKPQPEPKIKYKIKATAKQRYNLAHRVRKAGVVLDAKTRTIDPNSVKHADPLTRKRINKLLKHGYAVELKIKFT